ncbi:DnaA N-terminal domain-containing protein [Tistrella bauzanensis]
MTEGRVTIAVPTRFMRDWVVSHYADRIRVLWSWENPAVRRVDISVAGAWGLPIRHRPRPPPPPGPPVPRLPTMMPSLRLCRRQPTAPLGRGCHL